MTIRDLNLFSEFGARLQMDESIELTIQSMQAYGQAHDHWVIAWSGGKDSTATLTLIVWLITSGNGCATGRRAKRSAAGRQR